MSHPSTVALAKDDPWLLARLAGEKDAANLIVVPPLLKRPLPALSAAVDAIADAKKSTPRKRSSKSGDAVLSAYRNQYDLELSKNSGPMIVSLSAADRALLLMDTLLRACESRELNVFVENRQIRVGFQGHSVRVRITERLQKIVGSTAGLTQYAIQNKMHMSLMPTGELIIAVKRLSHERRIADKPDNPLENQLNAVVTNIVRGIAETKAWRVYFEKLMADYNRDSKARELEVQAKRAAAEEVERIALERRKQEVQFIADANAWQQSKTILAYADHLAAMATASGGPISADLQAWIEWAISAAESMDPTNKRMS